MRDWSMQEFSYSLVEIEHNVCKVRKISQGVKSHCPWLTNIAFPYKYSKMICWTKENIVSL